MSENIPLRSVDDEPRSAGGPPRSEIFTEYACPKCGGLLCRISAHGCDPFWCCVACDLTSETRPEAGAPSYPVKLRTCLGTGHAVSAASAPSCEPVVGVPPCHCCGGPQYMIRAPLGAGGGASDLHRSLRRLLKVSSSPSYTYIACAACDFVSKGIAAS